MLWSPSPTLTTHLILVDYAWRDTTSFLTKVFWLRHTIYDCTKVMCTLPAKTAFCPAFDTVFRILFVQPMARIGSLMSTSMFSIPLLYRMSPILSIFPITRRQCFHWVLQSINRSSIMSTTSISRSFNWYTIQFIKQCWCLIFPIFLPTCCPSQLLWGSYFGSRTKIIFESVSGNSSSVIYPVITMWWCILRDSPLTNCFLSINMIPCMYPVLQCGIMIQDVIHWGDADFQQSKVWQTHQLCKCRKVLVTMVKFPHLTYLFIFLLRL